MNEEVGIPHSIPSSCGRTATKKYESPPLDTTNLSELPEGWMWTRMSNITESMKNGIYKPRRFYGENGTACLRMYNIEDGSIVWKNIKRMNLTREEIQEYELRPGDILVNRVNSRELVGKAAAIPEGMEMSVFESKNIRLRLYANYAEPIFVSSWFRIFRRQYFNWHAQQVVGMASINQDQVGSMPIPFAPFREQQRIVAKVDELFTKLDAGVKSLETVKAQLKRYRQSVLKSAFDGELTEEWRRTHRDELEPASKMLERIKEEQRKTAARKYESPPLDTTNLSELPEGWSWTRVGEVATRIQYGSSEKATEDPSGVPVLRMGNIQEGNLIFEDLKYFSKDYPQLNDFMLDPGDVLFNRTNSAELVGKTAVYEHCHAKVAFASYLIRVKVNDRIYDPQILAFFINSYYGRRYIASVVSQQVGQANVNGTKLSAMSIPLPSLSEQKAIAEEIKQCFSIAEEVEKTVVNGLRQAEKLRQSILKRAFEGKLVSQDPDDDPANVLLERIKLFKAHLNQDRKTERPTKRKDSKQRRLM